MKFLAKNLEGPLNIFNCMTKKVKGKRIELLFALTLKSNNVIKR